MSEARADAERMHEELRTERAAREEAERLTTYWREKWHATDAVREEAFQRLNALTAQREEQRARADRAEAEAARLTGCLKRANDGFADYERRYYLEQERAEKAEAERDEAREALTPADVAHVTTTAIHAVADVKDAEIARLTRERDCNAEAFVALARAVGGRVDVAGAVEDAHRLTWERDEARANFLRCAQAIGVVYEADGHATKPGPVEDVERAITAARRRSDMHIDCDMAIREAREVATRNAKDCEHLRQSVIALEARLATARMERDVAQAKVCTCTFGPNGEQCASCARVSNIIRDHVAAARRKALTEVVTMLTNEEGDVREADLDDVSNRWRNAVADGIKGSRVRVERMLAADGEGRS